jgi:hypothetical protein
LTPRCVSVGPCWQHHSRRCHDATTKSPLSYRRKDSWSLNPTTNFSALSASAHRSTYT